MSAKTLEIAIRERAALEESYDRLLEVHRQEIQRRTAAEARVKEFQDGLAIEVRPGELVRFTAAQAYRAARILHSHYGLRTEPSPGDIVLAKHLLLVALTEDRPQSNAEVERMWRDREKA